MAKRILLDVAIGAGVQVVVTGLQFAAYLVGLALGLPFAFESAPENPATAPGWLDQINTMMLLAAGPAFLFTFAVAWLLRIADVSEGLRRGLIWTTVVALAHLVIGLGNGTVGMFSAFGLFVLLAAVWFGPILAGSVRGRRTPAVRQR